MKNIETILTEAGISASAEQLKTVSDAVAVNYKTVADYEKQTLKLTNAEESVKTLTASLDKFKDVNVDDMNKTIEGLKADLESKNKEYESKIADMAFDSVLTQAIVNAKGKDADIIKKNLDISALKESKNQSEDIKKALDDMAKNELTKSFFATEEPKPAGKGTFPAQVKTGGNSNNYLDDIYKNNPYYRSNH